MADSEETKKNKSDFLTAYDQTFGNISQAAKAVGIDRGNVYYWKEHDEEFREALEKLKPKDKFKDWLESKLVSKINQDSDEFLKYALMREERRLKSQRERETRKQAQGESEDSWQNRMDILDQQLKEAQEENEENDEYED